MTLLLVDAGKSSLLGVLVKGDLDDGRGSARVNLFRHKHEIETGRTSSVGMEILGFNAGGEVVVSDIPGRKLTWEEVGKRSAKIITFSDLAGHERYLRTTVFGMLSGSPDYCLLMVAANNGLIGMSKEHLGIAVALNVPVMVIITKIDICPPQILQETITQLTKILKSPGARKIPVFIRDRETCINTATQMVSPRIAPIFQVSNVTGENLDLVRTFLNILPPHGYYNADAPFEFTVNDTFSVPFVGTVVAGIVQSGVVHVGDSVLIGPDSIGQFTTTSVRSIERKRISVQAASAGQSASLALKRMRRKDVRKGMVVLPRIEGQAPPQVYREFVAEGMVTQLLHRSFSLVYFLWVRMLTESPFSHSQFLFFRTQLPSRLGIRLCCMSAPSPRLAPSLTLTDRTSVPAIKPRLPSALSSVPSSSALASAFLSAKAGPKDWASSRRLDTTLMTPYGNLKMLNLQQSDQGRVAILAHLEANRMSPRAGCVYFLGSCQLCYLS